MIEMKFETFKFYRDQFNALILVPIYFCRILSTWNLLPFYLKYPLPSQPLETDCQNRQETINTPKKWFPGTQVSLNITCI